MIEFKSKRLTPSVIHDKLAGTKGMSNTRINIKYPEGTNPATLNEIVESIKKYHLATEVTTEQGKGKFFKTNVYQRSMIEQFPQPQRGGVKS